MIEIEARLDELGELGLCRRLRLVSGPQGPRVVLDGRPAIVLSSDNYLGLADHPRLREAASQAAMRWGVGAAAPRTVSGTMTIHRRLEERLAALIGREAALVFGSGYLAASGAIASLARAGDIVFRDALSHPSIIDGVRLSGAEVFVYEHGDADHLEWGLEQAEGRGALIATDSVFAATGELAPLEEIVELAAHHGVRTVVDETHGVGVIGPSGRGAAAAAGVHDEIDVIVGSLGAAIGSHGGYACCDRTMARHLVSGARPLMCSTALPPSAAAAALAAVELLAEQPRRLQRLAVNGERLRSALRREGFDAGEGETPAVVLVTGDSERAARICAAAIERGVLAQAILPPVVPAAAAGLRLAAMTSHTPTELAEAARALAAAARRCGCEPGALRPALTAVAVDEAGPAADERDEARPAATGSYAVPFDGEALDELRRAA